MSKNSLLIPTASYGNHPSKKITPIQLNYNLNWGIGSFNVSVDMLGEKTSTGVIKTIANHV
jgi:hypothetical protein